MPDSKAEHTALKMKIVEYLKEKPTATQKELQEVLNETRTHIQKFVKELYSRGLSIAKAFKAHSEHGVVFNPSSVLLQSIREK